MHAFTNTEQLDAAFTNLADNLREPTDLYIDGPAAMLHYGSPLPAPHITINEIITTEDPEQLSYAADAVATANDLPNGWLQYVDQGVRQTYDTVKPIFVNGNLAVYVPTPEAMLSDRIDTGLLNDTSMDESRALCAHLNIKTLSDIRTTHRIATGNDLPDDKLEDTFEDLAEQLQFPRQRQPSAPAIGDEALSL